MSKPKPLPTKEQLDALLKYDSATGIFTWIKQASARPAGTVAGYLHGSGYAMIKIGRQPYMAHRLAWVMIHGKPPEKRIDHENRVRSDNREDNLRLATPSQNQYNRKLNSKNNTGVKGVYYSAKTNRFTASISCRKSAFKLGSFKTLEEAKAAVVEKRTALHGEFASHG